MKIIVAVDNKWGIGKDGRLLFKIPDDMKFFKAKTTDKIVVMGSKTLNSFPNSAPLPNRKNIVLSRKGNRDDCIIVNDLNMLFKELKKYNSDEIFVIGGAMIYKLLLPFCRELFVTKVSADGNADAFFENLDNNDNFECVYEGEEIESNSYKIKFTQYINKNVKEF